MANKTKVDDSSETENYKKRYRTPRGETSRFSFDNWREENGPSETMYLNVHETIRETIREHMFLPFEHTSRFIENGRVEVTIFDIQSVNIPELLSELQEQGLEYYDLEIKENKSKTTVTFIAWSG